MSMIQSVLVGVLLIIIVLIYGYIHITKKKLIHDNLIKNNISKAKSYLSRIENANSLDELYCIFREMINYIDVSFILNPYGMFRANSLEECRTTDIFLGDINGLWTLTLNRWMQTDDIEAVKEVTHQFKSTLINILNTYINHEKSK